MDISLIMVLVSPLAGVIGGGLMGAVVTHRLNRPTVRRQFAIQLLQTYSSPEGFSARGEAWKLRLKWLRGDRSCLVPFIPADVDGPSDAEEPKCPNGLTPHQNLSWLLHFYVGVQTACEAELADSGLVASLLGPHYEWYRQFFQELCGEYRRLAPAGAVEPPWLSRLPKLESLFRTDND
jgi:hypothetical protein